MEGEADRLDNRVDVAGTHESSVQLHGRRLEQPPDPDRRPAAGAGKGGSAVEIACAEMPDIVVPYLHCASLQSRHHGPASSS